MAFFQAQEISISFGGLRALDRVSFTVNKGEIFSIIGPNGAGKTTIFNCINRFYDLDEGVFLLDGKNLSSAKTHQIADMGIARTFQNIELFKNMTVSGQPDFGQASEKALQHPDGDVLFQARAKAGNKQPGKGPRRSLISWTWKPTGTSWVVNLPYGVQKNRGAGPGPGHGAHAVASGRAHFGPEHGGIRGSGLLAGRYEGGVGASRS